MPQRLLTRKFLLTYRENRGKKKGKGVKIEKRRKIVNGKVENLKWNVEKLQNEERTCFFISLFASHFSKPLKFVLGLPKWETFYQQKAFHDRKKIRKND